MDSVVFVSDTAPGGKLHLIFVFSIRICRCVVRIGEADEVEYRLIRDLLHNYDNRIRPSLNASEPLNVTFGLALAQIIDVVRILL